MAFAAIFVVTLKFIIVSEVVIVIYIFVNPVNAILSHYYLSVLANYFFGFD